MLELANDIGWYAPTVAYAENFSAPANGGTQNAYVYRFNEPNPWDGPWKGHANHILDVAFLFQNFNGYLSGEQKSTAEAFAEDVFDFCYGKPGWNAWESGKKAARVYGPNGKIEALEDEPEKVGRRKALFELAGMIGTDGLDALADAFNSFLKAPPPVLN